MFFIIKSLYTQSNIIHYTVDDGLPSSNVYSTFQDSKGFIWVCTDKGLARFDGYSFEVFTVKNGLPYNDVWGVQEDLEGKIWLMSYASHFTHYSYVDHKFHVLENPYEDFNSYTIQSINIADKKILNFMINSNQYFNLINNKIYKKNIGQSVVRISYPSYGYPIVSGQTKNKDSTIIRIDYKDSIFYSKTYYSKHDRIKIKTLKSIVWYSYINHCNEDHLYFYDYIRDTKSVFNYKELGINNFDDIISFIFYSKDELIILTNHSIVKFDKNLNYKILNKSIISFRLINNYQIDNQGNDWISTKNNGLFFVKKDGLITNKINYPISFLDISNKHISFGNYDGKILLSNIENHLIITDSFQTSFKIRSLKFYAKNQFLATCNLNIYFFNCINNKLIKNTYFKFINDDYNFNDVKKIVKIKDNKLLLTHYNKISIFDYNKNNFKFLLFGKFRYNTSIQDNIGNIWLASSSGLSKVLTDSTTDELLDLKQKYPLLSKSILDMQPDNQNRIWCGTDGYGVYAFKNNQVNLVEELKNEIINQVHIDYRQHVWVSTNKGGYRIILTKENPFIYQIKKFSIAQGLPTNEVNCIFADSNYAYFGTQKGLGVVDLSIINTKHAPAPFYIKHIVSVKDTFLKGPIVLPYNQSRLEFDFVCLSFKSNKNIVYYYKMQGIDSLWRTTDQLKIIYPILPPGKYTFFIKAKDIDDVFTEMKSIEIEITPPFWDTLGFKLSVTFALFFSGLLYLAYRIRAIKIKEMENTIVNKKIAELELQALQSQMNPHFMFNSLNAIQNFILNRTSDDASSYLGKFSKLMRLFLESSRNKYITIAEEIELIQLYIDMELIRYNNRFSAEIICENTQLYNQEIPSMLIQPFVENAINHGLNLKKENGHLIVKFWNDIDKIYMMVDDDGVGRDKAMEIKKKSIQGYVSRALEITNERLETMNNLDDLNLKIEIIDKTDDEGYPTGTRIMIELNNLD